MHCALVIEQRTGTDCMRCCVATVLGLDYDEVPDFVAEFGSGWSVRLAEWAASRGYSMLRVQGDAITAMAPGVAMLWIADGPGPGGVDHAIVYRGEAVYHDPCPGHGGLRSMRGVTVLVAGGT